MVQSVQLTGSIPKMARIGNPIIGFSKEDARRLHYPHDDALVISIRVRDYNTHRVMVDNGSSTDILYYPAFQQMRIDRERTGFDEHSARWLWRNKGIPLGCGHVVRNSQRLPLADH